MKMNEHRITGKLTREGSESPDESERGLDRYSVPGD